ncbi:peptidyl-prolyl cis-trans isomerase [Striga asiatica]|uniref:Peptidyl-prolyl cis-trans isomerase n=1 Tax=Striga asiatica TaxID=4170 RepID=A0A5A7QUW4_STRAF|nr:peptidyl-prolyl cis-trans isomerase [Striga asiatica]
MGCQERRSKSILVLGFLREDRSDAGAKGFRPIFPRADPGIYICCSKETSSKSKYEEIESYAKNSHVLEKEGGSLVKSSSIAGNKLQKCQEVERLTTLYAARLLGIATGRSGKQFPVVPRRTFFARLLVARAPGRWLSDLKLLEKGAR